MTFFSYSLGYDTLGQVAESNRVDPVTPPYPEFTNRVFASDSFTPTQYLKYYLDGVLVHTSTNINSGTIYGAVHNDQSGAESTWDITSNTISWDVGDTASIWNTHGNTDNYISGCDSSTTGAEIKNPTYFKIFFSGTTMWIYENTAGSVYSQSYTFSNDSVVKVEFGTPAPPTSGTVIPPPPAYVRL